MFWGFLLTSEKIGDRKNSSMSVDAKFLWVPVQGPGVILKLIGAVFEIIKELFHGEISINVTSDTKR